MPDHPAPESPPRESAVQTFRKLGPAGLLGILWSIAPAACGFLLLGSIGTLSGWLKGHGALGLAGYVTVFMVSAGLGFLPTYAQAILGGWVFGFALGFPGALAGFAGGSLIGYAVARGVSQERVQQVISEHPKWQAVRDALIGRGFWRTLFIVALVRLPPNSPFALTNLVLASTGVRVLPFALGTIIGMAPRTGLAVFLGAAGAASGAADIQSLVRERSIYVIIGSIAATVVVLAVIGFIANKAIARVTAGARSAPADPV